MCFDGSDGSEVEVTKPHAKTGTLYVTLEVADGRECILALNTSGCLKGGVVPAIITYVRLQASFQSSKEKKVG